MYKEMKSYDRDEDSIKTKLLIYERKKDVDEPDRESFVSHILVKPYIVIDIIVYFVENLTFL